MGFEFFLNLGSGWGLGSYDNNYFYKVIGEEFKDTNVLFDVGEFYEDYVETGKIDIATYAAIMYEKKLYFGKRMEQGNTARNKFSLNSDTLTSYWAQHKYWTNDPFVWIFGQFAYHNFSSLRYKKKAKICLDRNINVAFLYQGNPAAWTAIGWENKLFNCIRPWFERWQRKRFIRSFSVQQ